MPAVVLLENVFRWPTIRVMKDLFRDLKAYVLLVFVVDSATTGLHTARYRMYALALNLTKVRECV